MDEALPDLLRQQWRIEDRLTAAVGPAGARSRGRLLGRLSTQLRAARAAEEHVLYPALAARTTAAAGVAARGRRQHEEMDRVLATLRTAGTRAEAAAASGHLAGQLREHRRETMDTLLPTLAGLTPAEQRGLGRAYRRRYRRALRRPPGADGADGADGARPVAATLSVALLVLVRLLQRRHDGSRPPAPRRAAVPSAVRASRDRASPDRASPDRPSPDRPSPDRARRRRAHQGRSPTPDPRIVPVPPAGP